MPVKPADAFVIARSDSDEAISCACEPGRLLCYARNDKKQTLGKPFTQMALGHALATASKTPGVSEKVFEI
jgi:hypothetical protein